MSHVLDTNVMIELRDFSEGMLSNLAGLDGSIQISIVTQIELLNGIYRDSDHREMREARISVLLKRLKVLAFDSAAAIAYEAIVAKTGFSRRKILDRMIAAQALAVGATLVTLNVEDFADVPGLKLLGW